MPSLAVVKQANSRFIPSYTPIAVIAGVTSGIGEGLAKILSRYLQGRVHLVLVGRNERAAKAIISSLPWVAQESTYEFIQCDLSLMRNAHDLARGLLERLPKINFLVLSAGTNAFGGRAPTDEGIDYKLAVRYYSRWVLINDLMPLLRKAKKNGEIASVASVHGSQNSAYIDTNNLGFKKEYSVIRALIHSGTYQDFMLLEFSRRNPDIAFTHTYPGLVRTANIEHTNPFLKLLVFILYPLIWLVSISKEAGAEFVLFALLASKKGIHKRGWRGDEIAMCSFKEEDVRRLWEHTLQETRSKEN